jgi:hypothetical protein
MNPKYHLDDKVCLFYSERIIEQIRRSIYKKELVDIQKLFEEIETYFIIEITIKKDNVTYLINETNCRDYLTNFSVDENELTTDIETAKNMIKEIFRKELKEYQEIVNKSLENL